MLIWQKARLVDQNENRSRGTACGDLDETVPSPNTLGVQEMGKSPLTYDPHPIFLLFEI